MYNLFYKLLKVSLKIIGPIKINKLRCKKKLVLKSPFDYYSLDSTKVMWKVDSPKKGEYRTHKNGKGKKKKMETVSFLRDQGNNYINFIKIHIRSYTLSSIVGYYIIYIKYSIIICKGGGRFDGVSVVGLQEK